MKGVPFLSKRVYERIKGEASAGVGGGGGGKSLPVQNLLSTLHFSIITFLFVVLRFLLTG